MRMRGRRVQCGDSEGMEQVVGRMEEGQGEDVRIGREEEHCERNIAQCGKAQYKGRN